MTANCPECGEIVEARTTRVGFHLRALAMQVKKGPEHSRRCPWWTAPDEKAEER